VKFVRISKITYLILNPESDYQTGVYSALTRYQGKALYGLTVTRDYLGKWYLGCVFNVVELAYGYGDKVPIRNSFRIQELVEETQWTEFFLHKLR